MEFRVFDLGLIDFKEACEFQKEIFTAVKKGLFRSTLIICQHHPVITLGRLANKKNILTSEYELKNRGIQIYAVERGGDVTYHGPGQLVIYPIFNLDYFKRDIHLFLRNLEKIAIQILAEFGILAKRKPPFTGVWVNNKKITSIGIAIKHWITFYGLAINIKDEDLVNFSLIRPCGMDIIMTSMESILKRRISVEEVKSSLKRSWQNGQCSFA